MISTISDSSLALAAGAQTAADRYGKIGFHFAELASIPRFDDVAKFVQRGERGAVRRGNAKLHSHDRIERHHLVDGRKQLPDARAGKSGYRHRAALRHARHAHVSARQEVRLIEYQDLRNRGGSDLVQNADDVSPVLRSGSRRSV